MTQEWHPNILIVLRLSKPSGHVTVAIAIQMGGPVSTPTTTKRVTELTLRGLILGVLITVVFTAANVYIGLKVALTFATSIPPP